MSIQTTYKCDTLHIPLGSAYLCLDCNAVGNQSRSCPACASEALISIAAVLEREEGREQ